MKKVAIIYRYIPQYRVEFYNELRKRLAGNGIELILIYGQPGTTDRQKKDAVDIPWAIKVKNIILEYKGYSLYWQPIFKHIRGVDLVIVEQANKLLVNYILLFLCIFGKIKLAYWGHGKNFQVSSAIKFSERIKSKISSKVNWWFAYTKTSAEIVARNGFPREKITIVQNAINTQQMISAYNGLNNVELKSIKNSLGLDGTNIGLYVGGIYKEKRIGFLLTACEMIRKEIADFEMIIIGSGPDEDLVINFARSHSWLKYIGSKFGADRIPYFAISKLFLMPSSVGLAVLDCFATDLPLVTIGNLDHGPEIDYLVDDYNGILLENVEMPEDYAQAVIELLKDEPRVDRLKDGCRKSSEKFTLQRMVENFSSGIQKAVNQ